MAINDFIEKVCVQTAVHWSQQGSDGMGTSLFSSPREINVRWTESELLVVGDRGEQFLSKAQILIPDSAGEVNRKDYLFLGSLSDLESQNPLEVEEAYEIQRFSKVPMIFSTTIFVKTAYL